MAKRTNRLGVLLSGLMLVAMPAFAAEAIAVSKDIVPAPFGYDPVTARYVVTETTPLYVSPYIYPGTVDKTKIAAGQPINVIAKVRDYDWYLVGRNGVGIGYVPMERVAPARTTPR